MGTHRCPNGHDSEWADFCSACGTPIGGAPAAPAAADTAASAAVSGPTCPHCGAPNEAAAAFCEACGRDLAEALSPPTPAAAALRAIARVDREYFESYAADSGLKFPDPPPPPLVVVLDKSELTVGRRRKSRAAAADIDLSGEHDDPAVSHRHAIITRAADGTYSVTDIGSTNGTRLAASAEPIEPDTPTPIGPGASIFVGAWTRIDIAAE